MSPTCITRCRRANRPSLSEGLFLETSRWKIVIGFLAFAAVALFVLSKSGDIDMSGEKQGIEAGPAATVSAPVSIK